ncbi:MAG: DUF2971 domain-containing protein [Alphaproteobacteria bacterium]|nr:MAG: DUF2971 domain-containing protein [Alphaproteobacteria bacterium]
MSENFDPRQILFPHVMEEIERAKREGIRFSHYTSADTALKILRSERMYLRNSTLMNDFSEVKHGWNCLLAAYNSPLGERLKAVMRRVQPDLPEVLESNFNDQILHVLSETYLLSVSEHSGDHEDAFGRLSMWRAYAPKDGVAFVLNNHPFVSESDALNAFTSPVAYALEGDFQPYFAEMVERIEAAIDDIIPLGGSFVHDSLMQIFRFAVQSTKHPAFKEEREWRVIYSPTLLAREEKLTDDQMERVPTDIVSLGGVPQRVYSIMFRDYPEEGLTGATPDNLLNRILIGPSRDSYAIALAFTEELRRMGVSNPSDRVVITGIPLRL